MLQIIMFNFTICAIKTEYHYRKVIDSPENYYRVTIPEKKSIIGWSTLSLS